MHFDLCQLNPNIFHSYNAYNKAYHNQCWIVCHGHILHLAIHCNYSCGTTIASTIPCIHSRIWCVIAIKGISSGIASFLIFIVFIWLSSLCKRANTIPLGGGGLDWLPEHNLFYILGLHHPEFQRGAGFPVTWLISLHNRVHGLNIIPTHATELWNLHSSFL